MKSSTALLVLLILGCNMGRAAELQPLGPITFSGEILHDKDISAVAIIRGGAYMVIGGDEGVSVQVLRRKTAQEYEVHATIPLADEDSDQEIDVEGIAAVNDTIYVVGSHSRKRSQVEDDKTQKKNRERLTENELEPLREGLFRFTLDSSGRTASGLTSISLRKRIDLDPVLQAFARIPGKENGVDIEALAWHDDQLYVGFRGPVLRGGYVPVLVVDLDEPDTADLLYINLGGRGIRDMVRVSDGFLIVGGPVGDEPVDFQLYHWDGKDGVPGRDVPDLVPPKSLGRIPVAEPGASVEGVTLLRETATSYEVLIVYDGIENGGGQRFRAMK